MAAFLVLYHICGEYDFMFGKGQKFVGRIAEYDGTLDEAKQYFSKQAFYGGDESAIPEHYGPMYDGFRGDDPVMVVVAPFDKSMKQPLDTILDEHNAIHRKIDAKEQEANERAELKRLLEKYYGDDPSRKN